MIAENDERIKYRMFNGFPIPVDFNNSILKEQNTISKAESVIPRDSYSGIKRFLKEIVSPPKKNTAKNVKEIISILRKNDYEPKILIVGGGTIGQGMLPFYNEPFLKVISFDIYASQYVQFVADAHSIPLPDSYFDCVIIQAVREHVLEPRKVVSEIHRVLKQKGLIYSETPFLQHVHEGAYDFTRFTESGHRYLFRDFELIMSGVVSGGGTQLLWSIDYFFRGIFRSRLVGKILKLLFFWLQYMDKIIPEKFAVDAASGVFFLGRKSGAPIDIKSIIDHYKGAQ